MKLHPLALSVLLVGSGHAFVSQQPQAQKHASALKAQTHDWFGPAAVAMAGWAMAAQLSFAAPSEHITMLPDSPVIQEVSSKSSSSMMLSAFGFPGKLGGQSFDTLDFSLPSYSDAVGGGGGAATTREAPPAFTNPFGSDTAGDDDAESKAAVEQTNAEKKAAAQAEKQAAKAQKEAAKAEAEAKKAEEKAIAEQAKIDKEARRQAELEKQRAAVERANAPKVVDEVKPAPSLDDIKMPSFSAPEMPEMKLPDFKKPDMPEMPDMPKFEMPKFDAPKFEAPKFDALKFEAPKFDVPKFEAPEGIDMPKVPEMPKGFPSFSLPGGGGDASPPVLDENGESQEARDERARAARSVFLEYDDTAKDIERQAREARNKANEKKKIFNVAKDAACETRWGGKILCLRPFGIGY